MLNYKLKYLKYKKKYIDLKNIIGGRDGNLDEDLKTAIKNKDEVLANQLLNQGADPNVLDTRYGRGNALYWAIKSGCSIELCLNILNRMNDGVNGAIQNRYGMTALMVSISMGRFDLARELLNIPDLEINIQDSIGRTALHFAVNPGKHDIIPDLLANGNIDCNVISDNGSPLRQIIDSGIYFSA